MRYRLHTSTRLAGLGRCDVGTLRGTCVMMWADAGWLCYFRMCVLNGCRRTQHSFQRASASCINAATERILKTGETGAHRRNPLLLKHCSTPELPPPPLSRFLSVRLSVPPLIRINADAKFNVRHQILMASEE